MKCVVILIKELKKNISEFLIQKNTIGPGIVTPLAFIRQQSLEQDENRKWVKLNYNIFVYPLYDQNLYEFHCKNFPNFTDDLLAIIIEQCFQRKNEKNIETYFNIE